MAKSEFIQMLQTSEKAIVDYRSFETDKEELLTNPEYLHLLELEKELGIDL